MDFAQRLTFAMERKGMTQTELSKHFNISPQSVQAWCSGRNTPRDHKRVTRLAEVLDVNAAWLLTGEGGIDKPFPTLTDEAYAVASFTRAPSAPSEQHHEPVAGESKSAYDVIRAFFDRLRDELPDNPELPGKLIRTGYYSMVYQDDKLMAGISFVFTTGDGTSARTTPLYKDLWRLNLRLQHCQDCRPFSLMIIYGIDSHGELHNPYNLKNFMEFHKDASHMAAIVGSDNLDQALTLLAGFRNGTDEPDQFDFTPPEEHL